MTSWKAKVTSIVIIILILLKEETALARIFSNQKVVHGVVFSSDAFYYILLKLHFSVGEKKNQVLLLFTAAQLCQFSNFGAESFSPVFWSKSDIWMILLILQFVRITLLNFDIAISISWNLS